MKYTKIVKNIIGAFKLISQRKWADNAIVKNKKKLSTSRKTKYPQKKVNKDRVKQTNQKLRVITGTPER